MIKQFPSNFGLNTSPFINISTWVGERLVIFIDTEASQRIRKSYFTELVQNIS